MKPLALVAALLLALLAPTAPASAEDPAPVITWPEVTTFNPDAAPYTITVDDAELSGTLYAVWQGNRQALPHRGDVTLDLPGDGTGKITVLRCVSAASCTDTGVVSPWLQVGRALQVRSRGFEPVASSPGRLSGMPSFYPAGRGDIVQVTWAIVSTADLSGPPFATDTVEGEVEADSLLPLTVAVPSGLPEGDYRLRLTASADLSGYGHLEGGPVGSSFRIDSTAPSVTLQRREPVIYPIRSDAYLNNQIFVARSDEPVDFTLTIRNSAGTVVRTMVSGDEPDLGSRFVWSGKDESGRMVPEGRYVAKVSAVDPVGNSGAAHAKPFDVVLERVHAAIWRQTFTAASTVVDQYVGSCSRLARPSSHGWRGSLGYYSAVSCNNARHNVVSTISGIYIPEAFDDKYGWLQVDVIGGGARGTRHNYLVMGYIRTRDDKFIRRTQMQNGLGRHQGAPVPRADEVIRRDRQGRPFIYWQTGLTQGSRYDVKAFTVELHYTALS